MRKPSESIVNAVESAYSNAMNIKDECNAIHNRNRDMRRKLTNKYLKRYYGLTWSQLVRKGYKTKFGRLTRNELIEKAMDYPYKDKEYHNAHKEYYKMIDEYRKATLELKRAWKTYRKAGGEYNNDWSVASHEWDDCD